MRPPRIVRRQRIGWTKTLEALFFAVQCRFGLFFFVLVGVYKGEHAAAFVVTRHRMVVFVEGGVSQTRRAIFGYFGKAGVARHRVGGDVRGWCGYGRVDAGSSDW